MVRPFRVWLCLCGKPGVIASLDPRLMAGDPSGILPTNATACFFNRLLKGGAGIVFGRLCWNRGWEAAMLAHFISDLVIHILGPLFSKP